MTFERSLTLAELRRFDGERGHAAYVAYRGVVYDVSAMRRWRGGFHEGLHFAGQDLTEYLAEAPHGEEVFLRSGVVVVGRLEGPEVRRIDRPGLDGPAPEP